MPAGQFYKGLGLLISLCLILTALSYFIPILNPHLSFSIVTIVLFTGLSIFIFYTGNRLATSKNKYLYNNLIIINLILKILLSFVAVIIYIKLANPVNDWYLFLFILIYILFSSFEVYFMTIQAKAKR